MKKGITLLELLITSSIFSVIILSLYSAMHTGIMSYNRLDSASRAYHSARLILDRLERDLSGAFIYSVDGAFFKGSVSEVEFFKSGPDEDLCRVRYTFNGEVLERACYHGMEALRREPEVPAEELSGNVKEIAFEYASLALNPQGRGWQKSWPQENNASEAFSLPPAVKVRLLLIDPGKRKNPALLEVSRVIPLH
ncbi:MAG: type II secretion system protein GspJ [Candidatus Omnitrophica bacterium]|nr:type II secretion system protein GspJ [Candidatus Omnitrophota bacterium]MDD5552679.1 type II secretion system protein GspJ [Candidatus Omnitrophota bacterium]